MAVGVENGLCEDVGVFRVVEQVKVNRSLLRLAENWGWFSLESNLSENENWCENHYNSSR